MVAVWPDIVIGQGVNKNSNPGKIKQLKHHYNQSFSFFFIHSSVAATSNAMVSVLPALKE
ncbi:MAG: hypothetical protein JWR61_3004 [Ferruginibacter sp.]|nr:hypothetical protein [Ferruginibacter sp.]